MARSVEENFDLVRRIEGGDEEAETELVEIYARGVSLILLKRTGNSQLAMDLSQETFIVTIRKLRAGDLRKPQSLAAFIRQTSVNICNDHYRKEYRYVSKDDETISSLTAHRDNKGRQLDSRIMREILEQALGELTVTRDREILRRYYLADEDKQQICSDLDLSANHFDRVLYRAKQRMRAVVFQDRKYKSILAGLMPDG